MATVKSVKMKTYKPFVVEKWTLLPYVYGRRGKWLCENGNWKQRFTTFIQGLFQSFNHLASSGFERRQTPSLAERYNHFLTPSLTQLTGHSQVYFTGVLKTKSKRSTLPHISTKWWDKPASAKALGLLFPSLLDTVPLFQTQAVAGLSACTKDAKCTHTEYKYIQ